MKVKFYAVSGALTALLLILSCGNKAGRDYQAENTVPAIKHPSVTGDLENQFLEAGLVDIAGVVPGIQVDLKYSTTDNFMHTDMYGSLEKAYLHPEVAAKLAKAAGALSDSHPDLHFLVYDGARPLSIQQFMWDHVDLPPDQRRQFLSPPDQLSLHNYGAAVDITLATADGLAIDMGTPYDDPGVLSYPIRESEFLANGSLSAEQVANRQLLRSVMREAGFTGIDSEWWHFNSCDRQFASAHYTLLR